MALPDTDVAVIGAGPAGIAAARGLLAEGLRVTVIDPGLPPASRVESLPPHGIALAVALGLGPALDQARLGQASAMRLHWRERPETREFGPDGPLLLDKAMLYRGLRDLVPPECLLQARVRSVQGDGDRVLVRHRQGNLSARFVIDARGSAGLRAPRGRGAAQVALSFSGRAGHAPGTCGMLLQALADGWLWASLLADGSLSGALFLAASGLAGRDASARAAVLRQHLQDSVLGLPANLVTGTAVPAMLRTADDSLADPLVLRIGDAALARDPIAAHGLVHALRSGAQAAAAAATILDPSGQADAARAFVRDRHREAVRTAREATARAHGDQAQHRSAFWSAAPPVPVPEAPGWPPLSQPLSLSAPCRTAMLDKGRIGWAEAIRLPQSGQAVPRFGPVTAAFVAHLLGPPAPITTLSARLEQALDPSLAQAILRQLLDGGALLRHGPALAAQALAADASNA